MGFSQRLDNLERQFDGPERCAQCADRRLAFVIVDGDPINRNGGQRCGGCGWEPLVVEVVYGEPPPATEIGRGWLWLG